MYLEKLFLQDFRCFQKGEMELDSKFNIIIGGNGAGKTSILEAIHVLGYGRTFKHNDLNTLIRRKSKGFLIGCLLNSYTYRKAILTVKKNKSQFGVKFRDKKIQRRSDLLQLLPIQSIFPSQYALLESGPEIRRRFLDFTLFHVEPEYHKIIRDYANALAQYNKALRIRHRSVAKSFLEPLARFGENINKNRVELIDAIRPDVDDFMNFFFPSESIEYIYRPGWDANVSLGSELEKHFSRDLELGYSSRGPHRGDLVFRTQALQAKKSLSRGQHKLVAYAVTFAVIRLILAKEIEKPVLLIDDLQSELDENNCNKIIKATSELPVQKIITDLAYNANLYDDLKGRVFHVKHDDGVSKIVTPA